MAVRIMIAATVIFGAALAVAAQMPTFDAVSIKVTTERRGTPPDAPGRYYRNGVRLAELLTDAFGYPTIRLVGLPEWNAATTLEVLAKSSQPLTTDQTKVALQQMLADRFSLRAHTEQRDLPHYALTAPKGDGQLGPRLSRTKEDCAAIRADRARRGDVGLSIPRTPGAEKPVCGTFFYNITLTDGQRSIRYLTSGSTMAAVANFLSGPAQRVVVDRTGLAGEFDVDLEFSVLNGAAVDNQPSLLTAVAEELGLKLASQRGPIDVLVIDAVSRPTEN